MQTSGTLRRCEYSGLSTDVHRLILYSVKGDVMRQPKPWYRKSTRSWYVQIGRKQVRLGRDQGQAWVKYHELMSVSRGAEPEGETTIVTLVGLYLAWCEKNRAPSRYVPVGTMDLWSPSRRRLNDTGRLARSGFLVTSSPMAPPWTSSFGPSRLDWTSRVGSMTSADSCSARGRFCGLVPSFQASLTHRSGDDTHAVSADLVRIRA